MTADQMHTIESVVPTGPARLRLVWSGGSETELDLSEWLERPEFGELRNDAEFARVEVGDWGHSLTWPNGVEAGADRLWLETLSASGHDDARTFLEWRLSQGLSLSKAAEALGLSRRMIAYYSNGEKAVPKVVLLACLGWISERKSAWIPKKSRFREQESLDVVGRRPVDVSSGSYVTNWKGQRGGMKKHELFVEKRAQGDYAVRRGDAERASAVVATQAEAIVRARKIDPKAAIHVERVRNTTGGHPDKWRKP